MKIKRVVLHIEPNKAHEELVHVELDEILPADYEWGEVLMGLDRLTPNDDYFLHYSAYQIVGLRFPPSAFVTLKGLSISENEKQMQHQADLATRVLRDSAKP